MVQVVIGFRKGGCSCELHGVGDTLEAAAGAAAAGCGQEGCEGVSELEVLEIDVDGLDLTETTRRAEEYALARLASFVDFADRAAAERAIRGYQDALAASRAYRAKEDAILGACEALWRQPEHGRGAWEA